MGVYFMYEPLKETLGIAGFSLRLPGTVTMRCAASSGDSMDALHNFKQGTMSSQATLDYRGLAYFVSSIVMLAATRTCVRALSISRAPTMRGAPVAKKVKDLIYFGVNPKDKDEYRGDNPMNPPKVREDWYNWLRDETRKNPEVLKHLQDENAYAEAQLVHLNDLREELYSEMLSHLKETDEDVPHRDGNYFYYSKTQQGLSYKIHCRKKVGTDEEIVVLDENKLAIGHEYSDLHMFSASPSHDLIAYTIDHSGYETYSMRIVNNVATGAESSDRLEETDGDITWGADDSTLFYMTMDDEHRPHKLYMHVLGTNQSEDVCLYTEEDQMFWMGAARSADDKFLIINTESKETSEVYVINLQDVKGPEAHRRAAENMVCIRPREFGVRYEVEHHEGHFLVITNQDGAKNNKLTSCLVTSYFNPVTHAPVDECTNTDAVAFTDVKRYNTAEQIDDIIPFKHYIAVFGREQGTQQLWIINKDPSSPKYNTWTAVPFSESAYSVWGSDNYVFESKTLRMGYSSLVTPKQVIDYDMETGAMQVLKETEVPGYHREHYESRRTEAVARDGTKVPLSIVYNKKVLQAGGGQLRDCPVLLYGYGSYGACIDPGFDFKRTSLLDRGVVYVIANIRGGGEMGKAWYEDEGKYLTKLNTFHDFIDCGQFLVDQRITACDRLAIVGRSAGGLLIGAVCNMKPELFKAAVADVPFVDALNTMSDPTIPLTVTEWEEWGNPNEEKFYDYMLKYSPYDNVKAQAYPAMLITAGLNDPRVAYWEPAKWCAKLRSLKRDSNPLLLKTDMSSGHFSASDRYKFIKETAFEYAFVLEQIGAMKPL